MKYIIDRFEQDLAVCETQEQVMVTINKELLPPEAKEGDCIIYEQNTYRIDAADTNARRGKIQKKMSGLFE